MDTQNDKSTFKIGDVVRLNSGGPLMTVKASGTALTVCHYFFEGRILEEIIETEMLSKQEQPY